MRGLGGGGRCGGIRGLCGGGVGGRWGSRKGMVSRLLPSLIVIGRRGAAGRFQRCGRFGGRGARFSGGILWGGGGRGRIG